MVRVNYNPNKIRVSAHPWTKPEDVVVAKEPTPLGREGFFGTPYESEKGKFGLFVRADVRDRGSRGRGCRATGQARPADDGRHLRGGWRSEGAVLEVGV